MRWQGPFNYSYPTVIGSPSHIFVQNQNEWERSVKRLNGRFPVYQAHNQIHGDILTITKIFADFDDKKPENSQADAIKLCKFYGEHNIPHHHIFTFTKGFHVFAHLLPQKIKYNYALRRYYSSFLRFLQKELGLKTLDPRSADPKKLTGVPYTKKFKRGRMKYEEDDGFYIPLTCDEMKLSIPEIRLIAMDPQVAEQAPDDYVPAGEELFFHNGKSSLFNYLGVEIKKHDSWDDISFTRDIDVAGGTPEAELILSHLDKPCARKHLSTLRPPHAARIYFVNFFQQMGLSLNEVAEYYYQVAEGFGYTDRHNKSTGLYQIKDIYRRNRQPPGCKKIIHDPFFGFCVGETCPKFKKEFLCV